MSAPVLYGAAYSVYVRWTRLALEEKGVAYRLEEVDVFAPGGPPLQPAEPGARARMNQAISVLDGYAYRTLVWDIFVERVRAPAQGRAPDEAKIAAALPRADTCLAALSAIGGDGPYVAGAALTLADLHGVPMLDYFRRPPEGARLLAGHGRLARWLERMEERPSFAATAPGR